MVAAFARSDPPCAENGCWIAHHGQVLLYGCMSFVLIACIVCGQLRYIGMGGTLFTVRSGTASISWERASAQKDYDRSLRWSVAGEWEVSLLSCILETRRGYVVLVVLV